MNKNSYKYIVDVESSVCLLGDYEIDILPPNESYQKEFTDDNLIIAREKALKEAERIVNCFNNAEGLPTFKSGEDYKELPEIYLQFEVTVILITEEYKYCIYDSDIEDVFNREDILNDLLEEYKMFMKLNLDVNDYEETITYFDCEKGEKITTKILNNGMQWSDAKLNISAEIASLWSDDKTAIEKNESRTPMKIGKRSKFQGEIPDEIKKSIEELLRRLQN